MLWSTYYAFTKSTVYALQQLQQFAINYLNLNISTKRSYEIWGGPEGLAREIWDRKKAYEESERYRKGNQALLFYKRMRGLVSKETMVLCQSKLCSLVKTMLIKPNISL